MPATAEDLSVPAADLVIVGHFDQPPGYAVRRRTGAPSWLLMWTQEGAGHVEQGGAAFTVGPGDLIVLGSMTGHHYRVGTGASHWAFWWVHFQPRPSWLSWLGPYAKGSRCHLVRAVPEAVHERLDHTFRRASADARRPGHGTSHALARPLRPAVAALPQARELVLNAVEEALLLATAARVGEAQPATTGLGEGRDPRIRQVEALIAAEPDAPHTVASLAASVSMSPSRFAHLFTAQTGSAPMRAVRQARVRHAARLLEVTDMDVGQVATASGFASPFHFSRTFRKEYGLSPRQYRSHLRDA
ncbi:helix-turn-helix domain-containing protein [Nonomuraea sp. NPDC059194]|uniref:helix-turn-helix domain-containing protein n=1 Tax=Nonomuraea sp. NPDC059194 TaxID=3346764 RepID=UPI0036C52700